MFSSWVSESWIRALYKENKVDLNGGANSDGLVGRDVETHLSPGEHVRQLLLQFHHLATGNTNCRLIQFRFFLSTFFIPQQ